MSLKIDSVEALLSRISSDRDRPKVPFLYSRDWVECHETMNRLRTKLSTGEYGPKTSGKANELLELWNATESANPLPPASQGVDMQSIFKILTWTLDKMGFVSTSRHESDDMMSSCFERAGRAYTLRVLKLQHHLVAHFDTFELSLIPSVVYTVHIPLRFAISCVYPAIFGGQPPQLATMPPEVLVEILLCLRIEDMAVLSSSSRYIHTSFKGDSLWKRVVVKLSDYSSACAPRDLQQVTSGYKDAIAALLRERQRRRMTRFVHAVESSHWANPTRIVDPVADIRRRRIDVMDDLDLF